MSSQTNARGLWSKDFTCITLATVLSGIGGEAMNLPISLLVFEETQSTLASAFIMVCGLLPDILLPILAAPLIDRSSKKKWIIGMDVLLAALYLGMGLWIRGHEFSFGLYAVFTLIVGTISVFYRLSYTAWYPDLIPVSYEQKGYAVSSGVYITIALVMAPVAAFLYEKVEMWVIFMFVTLMTVLSIGIESLIQETKSSSANKYSIREYLQDMKEGFLFLKKEKGLCNIYSYLAITNGSGAGVEVLTQAFFQTSLVFTVTMLGFIKSAEMLGRVIGTSLQYLKEIPVKKRYAYTKMVYAIYDISDAVYLFLPYPLMLFVRFLCGALGSISANIRTVAVQCYLPENMRARVNAFFETIFSLGGIAAQLIAGGLGMFLPYRLGAVILGVVTLASMFFLIVIPKAENRPIYEATRE